MGGPAHPDCWNVSGETPLKRHQWGLSWIVLGAGAGGRSRLWEPVNVLEIVGMDGRAVSGRCQEGFQVPQDPPHDAFANIVGTFQQSGRLLPIKPVGANESSRRL